MLFFGCCCRFWVFNDANTGNIKTIAKWAYYYCMRTKPDVMMKIAEKITMTSHKWFSTQKRKNCCAFWGREEKWRFPWVDTVRRNNNNNTNIQEYIANTGAIVVICCGKLETQLCESKTGSHNWHLFKSRDKDVCGGVFFSQLTKFCSVYNRFAKTHTHTPTECGFEIDFQAENQNEAAMPCMDADAIHDLYKIHQSKYKTKSSTKHAISFDNFSSSSCSSSFSFVVVCLCPFCIWAIACFRIWCWK